MAFLRLYLGDTLQKQWKMESDSISIGRSDTNDIVLPSSGISKNHATIIKTDKSWSIVDNGSANGVFVNGKRVEQHKLQFWDEIQVFDYVIKYMASARLPGEQQGASLDANTELRAESTREFLIANTQDLESLREDKRIPHVSSIKSNSPFHSVAVDKVNFSIGGSKICDMRLTGWFKPRIAAYIQRRTNGYFLIRNRWGSMSVNGRKVHSEMELKDDDDFVIHRRPFKFYYRPLADA